MDALHTKVYLMAIKYRNVCMVLTVAYVCNAGVTVAYVCDGSLHSSTVTFVCTAENLIPPGVRMEVVQKAYWLVT